MRVILFQGARTVIHVLRFLFAAEQMNMLIHDIFSKHTVWLSVYSITIFVIKARILFVNYSDWWQ